MIHSNLNNIHFFLRDDFDQSIVTELASFLTREVNDQPQSNWFRMTGIGRKIGKTSVQPPFPHETIFHESKRSGKETRHSGRKKSTGSCLYPQRLRPCYQAVLPWRSDQAFYQKPVYTCRNEQPYIIDFDKARIFRGSGKRLAEKYRKRWQRAVRKHGLPDSLSRLGI